MVLISLNAFVKKGKIALLLVCLLIGGSALGQTGGDYELSRFNICGGGGISSGGTYALTGTMGQPDAGAISGGDYELLGGFWTGGPVCMVNFEVFTSFAAHWLEVDCNDLNNWCGGADLNQLEGVDLVDLKLFFDEWLDYCPGDWQLE